MGPMRAAPHPPARRRSRSFAAGLWLACAALAGALLMPCTPALALRAPGGPVSAPAAAQGVVPAQDAATALPAAAPRAAAPCPAHAQAGRHAGLAPQAPAPDPASGPPSGADSSHAHGPAHGPASPASCCAGGACAWMAVGAACAPEAGVPATVMALAPASTAVAFTLPPQSPVWVPALSRAPPPPPRPDVLLL